MLERDPQRRLKVGIFTAALLALLATSILLLGKKQGFFTRHVRYQAQFTDVAGLVPGAQVWLNGVVVGMVEEVELPEDPTQRRITVTFRVREKLAPRIRADSRVRIRTLGLLGDRFLELSSGSPLQPQISPGDLVPSVEPTDLTEVFAQGGDAMANLVAISASLRRILEKMERGEGLLGALLQQPEGGNVVEQLAEVLEQTSSLLAEVRQGKGFLGKALVSAEGEKAFSDLQGSLSAVRRLSEVLEQDLGREDTVWAALMRDAEGRQRVQSLLANLATTWQALAAASQELATGEGTLPRLLRDGNYAQGFLQDLAALTHSLAAVARKLDEGQGTAGRLLNDPQLYQDLENVVRGMKQSKLVSWFIQNRRAAGEKVTQEGR